MTEKGKLTGFHVLLIVIAFFGVMIAVNVAFISAAVKTYPGVSEKKSYFQGLHYNDTLADRAAQAQLGWKAEVSEVMREENAGVIVLRMKDADGGVLTGLALTGTLKRPAHSGEDQTLEFAHAGGGEYRAAIAAFSAGAWDLNAQAQNHAGETFDIEARVTAP